MDTLSGRIAAVSLGLTSWLVALATFLVAIGFLAGLPLAPFHLEGPLAMPPWHALALDGLLLVGLVAAVLLAAGRSHRVRLLMVSAVALLVMAFWQPLGGGLAVRQPVAAVGALRGLRPGGGFAGLRAGAGGCAVRIGADGGLAPVAGRLGPGDPRPGPWPAR